MTDLRKELEKYIGKLESTVVDSIIQFSVSFMFRKNKKKKAANWKDFSLDSNTLPPAPRFDSETGAKIPD